MTEKANGKKTATIGVVGLGLIGASLCMALKDDYRIAGCSRNPDTERYALQHGMIDEIRPLQDMHGVDCVVVCTPIWTLEDTMRAAYDAVGESAILTDVGSVKGVLQGFRGRVVGGHPMAGNEKSGIRAAQRDLFAGATYCVVPYENSREEDVAFVERMATAAGAHPLRLTAQEHDRLASLFSHMPHLAAYALAQSAPVFEANLAGSGFMDSTRIASSDPKFWTEVFRRNRENVLTALDGHIGELTRLRALLESEDYEALQARLDEARQKREHVRTTRRKR